MYMSISYYIKLHYTTPPLILFYFLEAQELQIHRVHCLRQSRLPRAGRRGGASRESGDEGWGLDAGWESLVFRHAHRSQQARLVFRSWSLGFRGRVNIAEKKHCDDDNCKKKRKQQQQ